MVEFCTTQATAESVDWPRSIPSPSILVWALDGIVIQGKNFLLRHSSENQFFVGGNCIWQCEADPFCPKPWDPSLVWIWEWIPSKLTPFIHWNYCNTSGIQICEGLTVTSFVILLAAIPSPCSKPLNQQHTGHQVWCPSHSLCFVLTKWPRGAERTLIHTDPGSPCWHCWRCEKNCRFTMKTEWRPCLTGEFCVSKQDFTLDKVKSSFLCKIITLGRTFEFQNLGVLQFGYLPNSQANSFSIMESRINGTAEWSPCETKSITHKCHSSWSVVHLWTYIEGSCASMLPGPFWSNWPDSLSGWQPHCEAMPWKFSSCCRLKLAETCRV